MSDKDTNSSEMPKKKSRQSLKVTLRKNIFWIKIFLGGVVGVAIILFSCAGYNAFTIFQTQGGDTFDNVFKAIHVSYKLWTYRWPSVEGFFLGVALDGLIVIGILYHDASKKNTKEGREYGSSRKGDIFKEASKNDALENKVEAKRDEDANIILSKNVKVDMDTWHTGINDNIFVVGGSGTGKTRYFVKPNILQMYCNYVVIDPKGSVAEECGKAFEKNGYNVSYLNLVKMDKSMGYNPFEYFRKPEDVQSFVQNLISNTSDKNKSGGDEFFVKAEMTWLMSMIYLIMSECRGDENLFSFNTVLMLLQHSDAKEDGNDTYESDVDRLFKQLQSEHRAETHGAITYTYRDLAILNYQIYKLGAGKTAKSILISCGARLAPFDIKELRDLTAYDELELDTLGEKKTALFVIISDTDATFNFIVSIMYSQLFNLLCDKADDVYNGRLPIHVRCLLDEFANIGQIPQFEKLIATIRSREISASIILQSKSQLKALYRDNASTIEGNCDTTLFLGGKEKDTLKDLAEILGKETIDLYNTSDTRGTSQSYGLNYQKTGKELMSQDEIAVMDGSKCIMQLRA